MTQHQVAHVEHMIREQLGNVIPTVQRDIAGLTEQVSQAVQSLDGQAADFSARAKQSITDIRAKIDMAEQKVDNINSLSLRLVQIAEEADAKNAT